MSREMLSQANTFHMEIWQAQIEKKKQTLSVMQQRF